jgi:Kef-type K+ transport system membrane component KefB
MPQEQSAKSHTATDTVTHLILLPILFINFGLSIYWAIKDPEHRLALDLWLIVLAFALVLINTKMRIYTLKIQDRVIRMEERQRISALVSPAEAYELSTKQLIALRFASDAELPALVRRTLAENLAPKQIKESIAVWRPDYERV